jgi:hypothetical protein
VVLAYDEVIKFEPHVVNKRLFDSATLNDSKHVAFAVDGSVTTIIVDVGHSPAAMQKIEQARALDARATDDSKNEPADFTVDDGFDL